MTTPTPALRSAIAKALYDHRNPAHVGLPIPDSLWGEYLADADAALSVLAPAPVEQAADARAAYDKIYTGFNPAGFEMFKKGYAARHFQSLATENKNWALAKEACRRVIHAIGRDHDAGSTGALAIEAIGKAFPEFAARASTGKGRV